MPLIII